MMISHKTRRLVLNSVREDLGRQDITTQLLVPKQLTGEAFISAQANGIVCGGTVVKEVFRAVDSKLKVQQKISDGSSVSKGKKIISISGKVASMLKGERVALNFLSHLSGIATVTHQFVDKIKGTHAGIYDTRKTIPLWRELEKYAVKTGGGKNHRFGLWDEVLVKDNHWEAIKSLAPLKRVKGKIPVEVEVASLKQLANLLRRDFIPDRILLDNFSVPALRQAVQVVQKTRKKIALEASGGITLKNVRQIAQTGVDRISIGALTHSAPALDFSLTLSRVIPAKAGI